MGASELGWPELMSPPPGKAAGTQRWAAEWVWEKFLQVGVHPGELQCKLGLRREGICRMEMPEHLGTFFLTLFSPRQGQVPGEQC